MRRVIAIIGNGVIAGGLAPVIDAANLVIRFNFCGSSGAGGFKTDIVAVCNTGRPGKAMVEEPVWQSNPCVREASALWLVREAAMFDAMRPELARSHPDLDDFCDDYTDGFRAIARATGKECHVIPAARHRALEAELEAFDPEPYVVPSSGLIVLYDVLRQTAEDDCDIVIAGFGHQGWAWHPFAAERRLVDHWAAQGRLTRLDAGPSVF